MNIEIMVALASTFVALVGLCIAVWQNILSRRTIQAQMAITLEDMSLKAHFADGVNSMSHLQKYKSFETFTKKDTSAFPKSYI